MNEYAGRYFKYKYDNLDESWDEGVIYRVREDGSIPFSLTKYPGEWADGSTFRSCFNKFTEVTEQEYLEQENQIYQPLTTN